ncbi:16S rRNA pseudouridine(516) synthase RsuA [Pseudaeromonas sp. ZJS20]|uniref:16S rRNA pseudouridine(516) synthase RsuA n=1 Tax=Pseudaeromonas aegiceratis TaxID=3153928 RepID=UPI00390CD612
MRLDKFLSQSLGITRSQASRLLRGGEVLLNGEPVKQGATTLGEADEVVYAGQSLRLTGPRYFMLHKPEGYVCSNEDPDHPNVFFLLEEPAVGKLHCVGRLDLDTTGLVLLTDDGQWSHRITSPRHECAKRYRVWLADPVPESAIAEFAEGIQLRSERELTRPAELELISDTEALLTIHEGKYHQVKRMFAAIGNKVVKLHREQIGPLALDADLAPGEYRPLSEAEVAAFL